MQVLTAELATVLTMLGQSRKALAAGRTDEGMELLGWAEAELGRHVDYRIERWGLGSQRPCLCPAPE